MKRIAFVVVSIMLPFSFAGCGTEDGNSPKAPTNGTVVVPVEGTEDISVVEFTLNDGTRCVVSDGYNSGGIDCDWN